MDDDDPRIPVPVIETRRLRLRGFTHADLDALAAIYADPDVMSYMPGGKPVPRERVAASLGRMIDYWQEHGFGLWAVARAIAMPLLMLVRAPAPKNGRAVSALSWSVWLRTRCAGQRKQRPGPRSMAVAAPLGCEGTARGVQRRSDHGVTASDGQTSRRHRTARILRW
jgi:hypothetical protein